MGRVSFQVGRRANPHCLCTGLRDMAPPRCSFYPKALKDVHVQHCGTVGSCHASCGDGAGIHPARNDPECEGRGAQDPERLGCRPAGTSLMSLGRATSCRIASVGRILTRCVRVCATLEIRAYRVTVVHPCRE